jgi:hypothetical protein
MLPKLAAKSTSSVVVEMEAVVLAIVETKFDG